MSEVLKKQEDGFRPIATVCKPEGLRYPSEVLDYIQNRSQEISIPDLETELIKHDFKFKYLGNCFGARSSL